MAVSSSHAAWPQTPWSKNRALVREGFADLLYLPHDARSWDATLAANAYALRQKSFHNANLSAWAVMNGVPVCARFEELGSAAVVLWHGTSAVKAERILQTGFRPVNRKAVYTSRDPSTSHAYTRWRSSQRAGGSAMFVLVFSPKELEDVFRYQESPGEVRLYSRVHPDYIQYVLWENRIEYRGRENPRDASHWPRYRFKKKSGDWVPVSQPPVRFSGQEAFATKREWLDLSISRILQWLGEASPIEIFSSLYATVEPWEALTHEEILAALAEGDYRQRLFHGIRWFAVSGKGAPG